MKNDLLNLEGRIALITGAGQGVGRETALLFAEHGCTAIILIEYFRDRADSVAREISALGCRGIVAVCDVSDMAAVSAVLENAIREAGGLDIIVNNAGNAGPGNTASARVEFWETEPTDWQQWLGTNLYGVLNICRCAIPHLIGRGSGAIINVISDAGRVGEPHLAVYSAAKAGVGGFSRAMAKALGRHNIRVNCVSISAVRTPGVARRDADAERMEKILRQYMIRRVGEAREVAAMILFLASESASWITGQTYPVNGGYSISQ